MRLSAFQVKRNHAGLSDQLLRIVRALDALEGRFAEQSHHHNSKTHQIHEALAQDLAQLEAVLAPNSAGKFGVSPLDICACRPMFTTLLCLKDINCASVRVGAIVCILLECCCLTHYSSLVHIHPLQQQESQQEMHLCSWSLESGRGIVSGFVCASTAVRAGQAPGS